MMTAASAAPSTTAGSSRCRKLSSGLSKTETKPDAGSTGYAIANTSTSISPNQKFGTERPSTATNPQQRHGGGGPRPPPRRARRAPPQGEAASPPPPRRTSPPPSPGPPPPFPPPRGGFFCGYG